MIILFTIFGIVVLITALLAIIPTVLSEPSETVGSANSPQNGGTSSATSSARGRGRLETNIFSSAGNTVLNSTGEIGWHLKKCSDGRKPELAQTSDPRIFGPIVWPGLHIMAENYPEKADKNHKKACVKFLEGLPWMLPCGHCGSHLLKRESQPLDDEGESIGQLIKDEEATLRKRKNLRQACKNRKALRSFLVEAHNNVSSNNKKNIWTTEQARQKYCQIPVCLEPCRYLQSIPVPGYCGLCLEQK